MPVEKVLGVILAGGSSRRMGFDKRTLEVEGRTLIARSAAVLAATCEAVVLSIGPGKSWPSDPLPVVHDRKGGLGPLAGLEAALLEAANRGLTGAFILACDLPRVGADLVRHLLVEAAECPEAAAVVPAIRGQRQPLCAFYRTGGLAAVQERLEAADRSMRSLLEDLSFREVAIGAEQPFFHPDLFRNLNRPADLAGVVEGSPS